MKARHLAAVTALVVVSVVAITAVRETTIGSDEMAKADEAGARADWPAAIAHARAAAEAFLPARPWPARAMLRLQAMGRDAEARGDSETALLAYGALRAAALATEAPIGASSNERWRTTAEDGLARLAPVASRAPVGSVSAPDPVAAKAMMDELHDVQPVPSTTLALVAAVSVAAIVLLLRLAAATA